MATAARRAWMDAWEQDLTPSPAEMRSRARVAAHIQSTRYYGREATARHVQPEPEIARANALPELTVVTRRRPQWRTWLAGVALAALLVGAVVVSPVLVSSTATGLEARVGELESEKEELATDISALAAEVSALSSPERVAEQASRLGLAPARSVQYVEVGSEAGEAKGDTTVAGR